VSKLVRKNLMVDAEEVAALARARGTSESEAVRYAVSQALASEEMLQALTALSDMGAFSDDEHVERVYDEVPIFDPKTGRVRLEQSSAGRSKRRQPSAVTTRRAS